MLFDDIFEGNYKIGEEGKLETNNWLLFIKDKNQLDRYLPRLTRVTKAMREETLAEIASAYVMENLLGYTIVNWEEKTVGDYDVDFLIKEETEKIYCEVKSPGWESELTKKELKKGDQGRRGKPKYLSGEIRWFAHWKNIRHVIKKAYPKFLSTSKNLIIVKDDLYVSILDFSTSTPVEIALYEETGQYNNEMGYFANSEYENVGGILFIDVNPTSSKKYKVKFFPNENSKIPFIIPNF
ncbi:MAG TPA: hypothetical protein VFD10_02285 [Atribacterota bacterium]|nr:hypothetical protein [Atribacterota bacterium]